MTRKDRDLSDQIIYTSADLRALGIPWSSVEIHRKIASNQFPRPFKLGPNTNAWRKTEIDAWLAERMQKV